MVYQIIFLKNKHSKFAITWSTIRDYIIYLTVNPIIHAKLCRQVPTNSIVIPVMNRAAVDSKILVEIWEMQTRYLLSTESLFVFI